MQIGYTLDTNSISQILREKNTVMKLKLQYSILAGDNICINAISYYETKKGLLYEYKPKESENFDKICREFDLILMDDISIFDRAAEIHARLKTDAKTIGESDIFIASIASIKNLTIVSENTRHFGFIQEFLSDLKVENWSI